MVGGPIALFDGSGATLVISPSSNFMAASNSHSRATNILSYGIMGEVDTVPPGYSLDTILYFGDAGVNRVGDDTQMFTLFTLLINKTLLTL